MKFCNKVKILAVIMSGIMMLGGCTEKKSAKEEVTEEIATMEITEASEVATHRVEDSEIQCTWQTPMIKTDYIKDFAIFNSDTVSTGLDNIATYEQDPADYADYTLYVGLLHISLYNTLVEPYTDTFINLRGGTGKAILEKTIYYTDYMPNELYVRVDILIPKEENVSDYNLYIQDVENRCPTTVSIKDSESVEYTTDLHVSFNQPFKTTMQGVEYTVICFAPVQAEYLADLQGYPSKCIEWTVLYVRESPTKQYENISDKEVTFNYRGSVQEREDVGEGTYLYEGTCILGKAYCNGKMHVVATGKDYDMITFPNDMSIKIGDNYLNIGEYFLAG